MRQVLTSFGQLLESWHRERFCAITNPYELMQNGTIDPWLLDTNTHTDFHSAQITCRNLTNGYVTTCLEVVSLTPTHGQLRDGPPSLRGDPP